jgi:hypothetical protein
MPIVLHFDEYGNILKTTSFKSAFSLEYGDAVLTSDGGTAITGSKDPGEDFFLLKLDSNDATQWLKFYSSIFADHALDVRQTNDQGFLIAGESSDAFLRLIKTDFMGNLVWEKAYGPWYGFETSYQSRCLVLLPNGDFIGYTAIAYPASFYLTRFDMNGNPIWTKIYFTPYFDLINSMHYITLSQNSLFVYGSYRKGFNSQPTSLIISLDFDGNIQWRNLIGYHDDNKSIQIYDVLPTLDNGALLGGGSNGFFPGDSATLHVALFKISQNGLGTCYDADSSVSVFDTTVTLYDSSTYDILSDVPVSSSLNFSWSSEIEIAIAMGCFRQKFLQRIWRK